MKKFISDTLFISIGGFLTKIKGIIFLPIIIASVGLANYGAFVQIYANVKILIPFCALSLGMGFQRFASKIPKSDKHNLSIHFYSILLPSMLLGLFGSLLLFILAPFLNDWFLEGKHLLSIQVSSIMVFSNTCYTNINKFLLGKKKFKLYAILEFSYSFIPYLGFVLGSAFNQDIFYGILYYSCLDLFISFIFFVSIAYNLKVVKPSIQIFKQYFQFSYPLAISNVQGGLLNKSDRYFISYFLGVELLGAYNIVHRIVDIVTFISVPIRKQIMSYLPKIWDKGYYTESLQMIRSSLLIFMFISVGAIGYLVFYFESILTLFVNREIVIENLELLVLLLGMASVLSGVKVFYYIVIRLKNITKQELFFQLSGMVLNIVLNLLLIPQLGILGAALATFLSYVLIILILGKMHKVNLDNVFFIRLFYVIIIASVFFITYKVIEPNNIVSFILSSSLAVLLFAFFSFLINKNYFKQIKSDIKQYKKLGKTFKKPEKVK